MYKKLFKESTIFCDYGILRKSSKTQNLTDSKCEYLVTVVKHFFDNHIILEYKVKNTLDNVSLNDVSLELTIKNPNLQFERIVPAK
jgi:coatomer protein complex subunit gamma